MKSVPVDFDDLESAIEWIGDSRGSAAYVSRATGKVHWVSADLGDMDDEPTPPDIDDTSLYVSVPSRKDLDLGSRLVFRFVRERMPDAYDRVRQAFDRPGAYRRFHEILLQAGQRDAWHAYQDAALRLAVLEWAEENDLQVAGAGPAPAKPIELDEKYVLLSASGEASVTRGGDAFWSQPRQELERFGQGWLVAEFAFGEDWPNWEMHPAGDEIVYLLSGDVEVHLETPDGVQRVRMDTEAALVIPRGAWHTVKVRERARMLHVTLGAGTQHRPVSPSDGS